MSLTLEELKDKLKRLDEITLLEVLDVDSEDLVEGFHNLIEDKYDQLVIEFEEEEEE